MPADGGGFAPSGKDTASVLAWFAEWDQLAAEAKIDQMADMAMFPVNTVTTNAEGEGFAEPWDREKFRAQMGEAVGGRRRGVDGVGADPALPLRRTWSS